MIEVHQLVAPVVALVVWTIIMLFWAVAKIQIAIRSDSSSLDASALPRGTRARDVETRLAPDVSWPRQNYEHLVEQPTLFYALMASLALMGTAATSALWAAWAYVAFRVLHSFQQAFGRNRMIGFVGSTICLVVLARHAVVELVGRF